MLGIADPSDLLCQTSISVVCEKVEHMSSRMEAYEYLYVERPIS